MNIVLKLMISLLVLFMPCFPMVVVTNAQDFDFFYLVLQWPGAYCDSKQRCCYPSTGKPASDFGIHGLWPNYNDGSYPQNCDPDTPYDESQVYDLKSRMQANWPTLACPSGDGTSFWSHEWVKHGTCSNMADQHSYFGTTLQLKNTVNLLNILENAGIMPNDGFYSLHSVSNAIRSATGYNAGIECNKDASGNSQLYQIYFCVDTSATEFIECPVYPSTASCNPISHIQFPAF